MLDPASQQLEVSSCTERLMHNDAWKCVCMAGETLGESAPHLFMCCEFVEASAERQVKCEACPNSYSSVDPKSMK